MQANLAPRPSHVPLENVVDFNFYAPPGVKADFHRAWKALQAEGMPPIVWTPHNGGHWIVTRAALINEVMGDYERFSNHNIMIPKEIAKDYKLLPVTLDPPAHRPYRNLLNSGLSPKVVNRNEAQIRQIAVALIEDVRERGYCSFTKDYAERLPILIFLSMVDLPIEDAPRLKEWADQITRPTPGRDWGADGNGFAWGVRMFYEYLAPHIDARIGSDRTDMLSHIINGTIDGRPLEREEILQLCTQIVVAGLDTVVNFLSFAIYYLAVDDETRRSLVEDPTLIPAATEELLRRFPLVTIGREVARDIDYAGVQLKAGDMVAVPTPLSGLDDQANPDPMRVDFRRASAQHTTFGNGPHRCPGAHLGRLEIQVTLEEWLRRIPEFRVSGEAGVRFTGGVVGTVDELLLEWTTSVRA